VLPERVFLYRLLLRACAPPVSCLVTEATQPRSAHAHPKTVGDSV